MDYGTLSVGGAPAGEPEQAAGAADQAAGGGVRLAVDLGSVRVGVAACDPSGVLAVPVETVPRDESGGSDLTRIAELAAERGATGILVGLPRRLAGDEGPAAAGARAYAAQLAARVAPVPVRLVDERLTTVAAQRSLRERGVRGRKGRQIIDQAAAVVLLQWALDVESSLRRPVGELVDPAGGPTSMTGGGEQGRA